MYKDPEKKKIMDKLYRDTHKAYECARGKRYRTEHPNFTRDYYLKNRESILEYNRNFPKGFQVLCANHNLKKELERKRAMYSAQGDKLCG